MLKDFNFSLNSSLFLCQKRNRQTQRMQFYAQLSCLNKKFTTKRFVDKKNKKIRTRKTTQSKEFSLSYFKKLTRVAQSIQQTKCKVNVPLGKIIYFCQQFRDLPEKRVKNLSNPFVNIFIIVTCNISVCICFNLRFQI